jgi:hypothetical protein
MTTMTRQQAGETIGTSDAERHIFSILVLVGTIAFAGTGMAVAILLGAHVVQIETLAGLPIGW